MYPTLSASRGGRDQAAMSNGLPAYFVSSFYPHMEMEMEMEMSGDAIDATPMDRALAATRNHREAERRRRERIKSHLDRLRSILACDPKTDKASLLAKVVERMKDLKQRTEEIADTQFFPTETDEIVVLPSSAPISGQRSTFEASLCCEDRSDLLPELIETLRSLHLKTLRAEIATLGGRVRNVLILAKDEEAYEDADDDDDEDDDDGDSGGAFLRDALKALVDRSLPAERCKRRRLVDRNPS
ncbi:transcription factor bHLH106-like [Musa acuminata AAA Group]|uniref:transcription factor bHLH106-like n=1 Tax=Musa acuminata AAA Group TaxID=214697 RepID=UPI0031E145C5